MRISVRISFWCFSVIIFELFSVEELLGPLTPLHLSPSFALLLLSPPLSAAFFKRLPPLAPLAHALSQQLFACYEQRFIYR
jgi:hypothetical protein